MPTQFANTLNNHPIYADRAEKDAAGNNIGNTYQPKLTAGTGISIDSDNVISVTGGGGGATYTAGDGINIDQNDEISVVVSPSTTGDLVALDCEGHLVDSGIDPSDLQPALTAGTGITIDSNNVISATGGGGGTSYTAGDGVDITNNEISVKTDNTTITTNANGELVAASVSGGWTVYHFSGFYSTTAFDLFNAGDFTISYTSSATLGIRTQTTATASITAYCDVVWSKSSSPSSTANIATCSGFAPGQNIASPLNRPPFVVPNSTGTPATLCYLEEYTNYSANYPSRGDVTIYYEHGGVYKLLKLNFIFTNNGAYNTDLLISYQLS